MPWLVIYIGLLFPITLLLVVLAMDWYDNSLNDRRRRAFHIQEQSPKTKLVSNARNLLTDRARGGRLLRPSWDRTVPPVPSSGGSGSS